MAALSKINWTYSVLGCISLVDISVATRENEGHNQIVILDKTDTSLTRFHYGHFTWFQWQHKGQKFLFWNMDISFRPRENWTNVISSSVMRTTLWPGHWSGRLYSYPVGIVAFFCHCAYLLRISGWSKKLGFLKDGAANTKVFYGGLWLLQEKQISTRAVASLNYSFDYVCFSQRYLTLFAFWGLGPLSLISGLPQNFRKAPKLNEN